MMSGIGIWNEEKNIGERVRVRKEFKGRFDSEMMEYRELSYIHIF